MDPRAEKLIAHWMTQPHVAAAVEAERDNAAALALDQALYGITFTDVTGKRIDPTTVKPGSAA